jgi:hypothetical protein
MSRPVGWEEVSTYRDVTKVLIQPVWFCVALAAPIHRQLVGCWRGCRRRSVITISSKPKFCPLFLWCFALTQLSGPATVLILNSGNIFLQTMYFLSSWVVGVISFWRHFEKGGGFRLFSDEIWQDEVWVSFTPKTCDDPNLPRTSIQFRGVHRVFVGKPEGKRPLGRPRRRWEDNIKMNLQDVGGACEDWIELA